MLKTIIKGLLAASMLAPIAAQAQDDPGTNPNAGISRRGELREMRERGQREAGDQDRGDQGRTDQARGDQSRGDQNRQAQVQAQAQVQMDRQQAGRPNGGYRRADGVVQQQQQRGNPGDARGFNGNAGAQVQRDPRDGRADFDRDRQAGRPDWNNGDRNGRADPRAGYRGDPRRDAYNGDPRRDGYRGDVRRGGYAGQQWDNRGGYGDRGDWNRGWRNDNRYNWSGYRAANRSAYRLPRYYAPRGWSTGYRRFGIGFTLNSILFDRTYWIADPWTYRLPPAYGPYRWVRYYDDALLVDLDSGEVVDTVYNIFW